MTVKPSSWAESLAALDIQSARQRALDHQKQRGSRREAWIPQPYPSGTAPAVVGYFATRQDWFEPAAMPEMDCGSDGVAYPCIEGEDLVFRRCSTSQLVKGPLGILQAPAHADAVEPSLIFVPCVLADEKGRRIGRGRGYYDRYIARHPRARAIGLVHTDYLMNALPASWLHDGDQNLAGLISQRSAQIFQPENRSIH